MRLGHVASSARPPLSPLLVEARRHSVAASCRWLIIISESRPDRGSSSFGHSLPPRSRSSFTSFSHTGRPQCDRPRRCLTSVNASKGKSSEPLRSRRQPRRCNPADLPFLVLRCLGTISDRRPHGRSRRSAKGTQIVSRSKMAPNMVICVGLHVPGASGCMLCLFARRLCAQS